MTTGPLCILLSVKLSDGSFDATVSVPMTIAGPAREAAVTRWLALMQTAMAQGVESLDATLDTPSPESQP